MKHRILMAGSVPLAAPWNGADKNFARILVRRDLRNRFIVHTSLDEPWEMPSRVTAIRSRHVGAMPTTEQRLRGFGYMLQHSGAADLLHIVASLHSPSSWIGPALRAWSNLRQRPIVHTLPSVGDVPIARRNFAGDATVVVSEHTRRRLEYHGVPNVYRVHPPIEIEDLLPRRPGASADLASELELGACAVLYPAHYGKKSGIREMVQAFAGLRGFSGTQGAVLVLACRSHPWQDPETEKRKVLQQAAELGISDRVRILGYVVDMPALISACSVTVLVPGKLNAKMDLPLVILESLALGRPVIVGDRAPISEALLGGGGYMVPYGDVSALTRGLARLLANARLRETLAAGGRAAVLERCDTARVVERYQWIYEHVIKSNSDRGLQGQGERRNGAF